jgi:hypothetical protein
MASKPAETEIKDSTKYHVPEQTRHQSKKRALEEDTSPDITKRSLSGGERDAYSFRDTMSQSTSPSSSARRTRTGRVSKAAKGIPVHHCDCGKTYTRAEHLRRHQQNHEPGAFSCDVLGCGRTFSREDLLIRHKAKHDDSPGLSEPSTSNTTQSLPAPGNGLPYLPYASTGVSHEARTHPGSQSHRSSLSSGATVRKGYISIAESSLPDSTTDAITTHFGVREQFDGYTSLQPLQYIGSRSQAANPWLEQSELSPLTLDINQTWNPSTIDLGAARSPVSPDSMAPTSTWRRPSPAYVQLRTPASENSVSVGYSDTGLSRNSSFAYLPGSGAALPPEYRDFLEQDELVTPTSAQHNIGARQCHHHVDNEQRYLDVYWRLVHPIWPVVHRPTFDMAYTSPLLRSAMITLGACYTGDQIDAANACILHKRCLKVIKLRTVNNRHSYRICDMQAILLVELFATYRSRRPPLQSTKPFQDNYCELTRDHAIKTVGALSTDFDTLGFPQGSSTMTLECESRERLLAAYYILDQGQAAIFGRHRVDVPDLRPANLGLPQPLHIWDSHHALEHDSYDKSGGWQFERRGNLGQGAESTFAGQHVDIFVASLALAYLSDIRRGGSLGQQNLLPDLNLNTPISKSPYIELARQTFALCNNVPVRALLAVAGESWVMAEKLSLYADYKGAQETLRLWTNTSASTALAHALEILRLHRTFPKTSCFYHEWSLHLASLVLWACTYARRLPNQQLRLVIPLSNTLESEVQGHQLEEALASLVQAGMHGRPDWDDTKCVFAWAKSRIEKTGNVKFCGVLSGAVDVLKALMTRGEEDGWF